MINSSIPAKIRRLLGDFDPNTPPPSIQPVAQDIHRPLFSVVIPTFNCARYLIKTLESVLEQDPGPEKMHIEVIDDCSTQDDPEAVVKDIGKGRVIFTRNNENTGCCSLNFNNCLRKSIGHWVHVLHGDDYVLPGFYTHIEEMIQRHPSASLLSTRALFVDADNNWTMISPLLPELQETSHNTEAFSYNTPIQCAGVVVKRAFYEENGGFREDLVHTSDWEMWERVISTSSAAISTEVLAAYRHFDENDTSRLMQTGGNLVDRLRLIDIFTKRKKNFNLDEAIYNLAVLGRNQECAFKNNGNHGAAATNSRFWRELGCNNLNIKYYLAPLVRRVMRII